MVASKVAHLADCLAVRWAARLAGLNNNQN